MISYVTICNKGGVGKTTVTSNLAYQIAQKGKKVLVIDFDPNNLLCLGLGIKPHDIRGNVISFLEQGHPNIVSSPYQVDVMPSGINSAEGLVQFTRMITADQFAEKVKIAIGNLDGKYDYVFIDTPSAPPAIMEAALCSVDRALVVIEPEPSAFCAVSPALELIGHVIANGNQRLQLAGVLINGFSERIAFMKEIVHLCEQEFADLLLNVIIPRDMNVPEAFAWQKPVKVHAPGCAAAQAFEALTNEIIENE
ncbi:MAG: ParA family protein [Mangrovibacterium sp.]